MAGFRARFGRGFDAGRETAATIEAAKEADEAGLTAEEKVGLKDEIEDDGFDDNGFAEEEDANLLDLISSFGQQGVPAPNNKQGGGKKK